MAAISELLASAREQAGLTQRQLGAETGIPQASVSLIERGLISPRASTVERWLTACGVTLQLVTLREPAAVRSAPRVTEEPPERHPDDERHDLDWASWMS